MLTLIIGGAGSGKSAFAEALCCSMAGPRFYLATMVLRDEESRQRAGRHRRQRSALDFITLELPFGPSETDIPDGANVLLEDLPNLLANEMFDPAGGGAEAVRCVLDNLIRRSGSLTVVSGDVFSGGTTYTEETLCFMRELAALHRELAERADLAVEVICGLPNILKGELP